MSWNEPGGSNGDKDPWGNRNKNQGPPDLDEVFANFRKKFGGIFGDKSGGNNKGSSSFSISFVLIGALVIWALSGIYIIDEGKQGVVLQFGEFHSISEPGPHWYPRFIQSVETVDISGVRSVNLGRNTSEALMLTKDENIVDVEFTVQYKVKNAKDFLFNVSNPTATLIQATESAIREIVGKNNIDFVIQEGRPEVAARTEKLIQDILDDYKAGIQVTNLNMQDAQAPEQVQEAFDDAIRSREDRDRKVKEAEAYKNDIIPKARGAAARLIQEATAYRDEKVARSSGEANRFNQILIEYKKAPKVTRERLYLETMQDVLSGTNKVMVDVKQGNSLMYLPVDKLMRSNKQGTSGEISIPDSINIPNVPQTNRFDDRARTRGAR